MKRIIKISSLGLVALLASCGNKLAPLAKISPEEAVLTTRALLSGQASEKEKLFAAEKEQQNNPLYEGDIVPYTAKTLSADITFKYNNQLETAADANNQSIIVAKHLYFDMDKLFFHSHIDVDAKTSDSSFSINYPKTDMYVFFIEDEKQIEDTPEFEKTGTTYQLLNYGDVFKIGEKELGYIKSDFLEGIKTMFTDATPIYDNSSSYEEPLNIEHIVTSGLNSVTTNWNITNQICYEITSNTLPVTDEILLMQNWLGYFNNLASNLEDFRNAMIDLDQEGNYFDYAFRSNDTKSFGVETNVCRTQTMSYGGISGKNVVTETSSLVFKNLYLTDSHFVIETDTNATYDETGELMAHTHTLVSCDQYVSYNTSEKDSIPSDYLDYLTNI